MSDDFAPIEPGIFKRTQPLGYRIENWKLRKLGETPKTRYKENPTELEKVAVHERNAPFGLTKYPDLVDADDVLQPYVQILNSEEDHKRWHELFEGIESIVARRGAEEAVAGFAWIREIGGADKIPTLEEMNKRIRQVAGFELAPAIGLLPNNKFFRLLMEGKFPVTISIRNEEEKLYTPFPDMFHDLAGHAPMFLNRDFCDFVKKIGELGLSFPEKSPSQDMVAKLYWYTIEFGLMATRYKSSNGNDAFRDLRVYGAGIISSKQETVMSVEAARATGERKISRLPFELERVLLSHYEYEQTQELYFVISDYAELVGLFDMDLKAYIEKLSGQVARGEKTMIAKGAFLPGERERQIPPNNS